MNAPPTAYRVMPWVPATCVDPSASGVTPSPPNPEEACT